VWFDKPFKTFHHDGDQWDRAIINQQDTTDFFATGVIVEVLKNLGKMV